MLRNPLHSLRMSSGRTFDDFKNQVSGWFVDIDGSKSGPFFLDQIMSMVHSGKIAPHHRITALHLKGQWISANELMGSKRAPGASFQPPPRPGGIENPPTNPVLIEDPAVSLFDALKVVKEKKQNRILPEIRFRGDKLSLSDWLAKNPWAPVMFLTAIVVMSLIWGMIAFMKKPPIIVINPPAPQGALPSLAPVLPVQPLHPGFTVEPAGHMPLRPQPPREEPHHDDVPENHIDDNPTPVDNEPAANPEPAPETQQNVQAPPPQEQ